MTSNEPQGIRHSTRNRYCRRIYMNYLQEMQVRRKTDC